MNKILGLDLGTNSIGWALRDPNVSGDQIEKFGVITFKKGVGIGKTGEYSYAAERTSKRATRRLYQARKYRLWATLKVLITEGYCPLSIESLNKWRHYNKEEAIKNHNGGRLYPVNEILFEQWIKLDFNGDGKPDYTSPYQLRKALAEHIIDFTSNENRYKLGRALYHIAQRRGFKSSRKIAEDSKESNVEEKIDLKISEKKRNQKISELFEEYPEAKTIGWLFAILEQNGNRIRENLSQYAIRENYKDEITHIFNFQSLGLQHPLYQLLVERSKNKNDGCIFYKRPLRSQKGLVGKCTLEPSKFRIPISHPEFEKFRAWSFLNNIRYKTNQESDWQKLPLQTKQDILKEKFFRKSKPYFQFQEIIDFLKTKGCDWIFNYTPRTTVMGCPVSGRFISIFGDDFFNIRISKKEISKTKKDFYNLDDIWHLLFFAEDQDFVAEFAINKLKLEQEQVKEFLIAWNTLPSGYAMLSLNVIRKLNKFLVKGLDYTESVLLGNLPTLLGSEFWNENEDFIVSHIADVIEANRMEKKVINIVNTLIARYKNLEQKFGYKDNTYILDDQDHEDIQQAIEDIIGKTSWLKLITNEKDEILRSVHNCYQAFFTINGLQKRTINGERFFEVKSNNKIFFKSDSGYYKVPRLGDTIKQFLYDNFLINYEELDYLYHPSDINIYPPAKEDEKGNLKLGTPVTGSFKNPMALRTLHELRKLINYLLETKQIDSDTRIVVEVARDLNDSNKRWAIEAWQKQRELENHEFALAIQELLKQENIYTKEPNDDDIDKVRLWYEQSDEESLPPVTEEKKEIKGLKWVDAKKDSYKTISTQKTIIEKYILWKEQDCECLYTGRLIKLTDLFKENVIDIEHTIPRSISFDNSLANQTVCFHDYNRTIKKNKIPTQLNNYSEPHGNYTAIEPRLQKWKDKVARIKQQIDFWNSKSKRATTKDYKDLAIRQRHLWQMEFEYWSNKLNRFLIKEVTNGFKNSQKIDTQLISKYALHYLRSLFEKVDVQKGSITAEFRKIYGLQEPDEKKDRGKHSHHAKDAAVLTLIPTSTKRDEILKEYYEHKEALKRFSVEPYKEFKREFVWKIDDATLINFRPKNQTLTPAIKKVKKKGKPVILPGTNKPMIATGDCIRGQLHKETFYGAIKPAKRGEKGNILKTEDGKFLQEDKLRYVIRVPFLYKQGANTTGFKTLEEIKKQTVDHGLKQQIEKQVLAAGGLKEAFDRGIYMLDKQGKPHGNKIRHIRVWASPTDPLKIKKQTFLSKNEYKQYYYAANDTNSYFAIYKHDELKEYDYRNLLETAQVIKTNSIKSPLELFEPFKLKMKGKKEYKLDIAYVLENGTKVIFIKKDEEAQSLSISDILKRLYIFTSFEKDGRLNFKYHLEARNKIDDSYLESELDFVNPKPTLRFTYSKYEFLVEGYDFTINIDGSLSWK